MIDPVYKKPIRILPAEGGGGFVIIPMDRKGEVHAAFDRHGVPYWDTGGAFAADGGPWKMSIELSVKADVALAQRLLDELP